jgi:hypothetical protein
MHNKLVVTVIGSSPGDGVIFITSFINLPFVSGR